MQGPYNAVVVGITAWNVSSNILVLANMVSISKIHIISLISRYASPPKCIPT